MIPNAEEFRELADADVIVDVRLEEGKRLLAQLVAYLNRNDFNAKLLWAILTALRGPDQNTYGSADADLQASLKDRTTARVRYAVGIREGIGNGATVADVGPDEEDASVPNGVYTYGDASTVLEKYVADFGDKVSHHFVKHYSWAVKALQHFGLL